MRDPSGTLNLHLDEKGSLCDEGLLIGGPQPNACAVDLLLVGAGNLVKNVLPHRLVSVQEIRSVQKFTFKISRLCSVQFS